MWGIPAFAQAYVQPIEGIMRSAPADVALDFPAQLAKVGHALITGAWRPLPRSRAISLACLGIILHALFTFSRGRNPHAAPYNERGLRV